MSLLVFNSGSTSLKFALFHGAGSGVRCLVRGQVAPLQGRCTLRLRHEQTESINTIDIHGSGAATRAVLAALARSISLSSPITCVAHRVVYGGPGSGELARIDERLLERLSRLSALAPLHLQFELEVIRAAAEELGHDIPAFAAFDTGYFAGLPAPAREYAIPRELASKLDIRRAGFHGFAHRSMFESWCVDAGKDPATAQAVTFQLGGGCSAAAIAGGKPLDTSMGHTPLEGLVMDTRCGDIDAGAVFECLRSGIAAEELHRTLERDSGLLGLSGLSAEPRRLLEAARDGHAGARLAIDVYCHRARKYLGAYLAVLGGADAVLFGGGVGEHLAQIRERICSGMEWCGVRLDPALNELPLSGPRRISHARARTAVWVVPVDEEQVIARLLAPAELDQRQGTPAAVVSP
jgi:acetate kinase